MILVTGGTGFIGRHLLESLCAAGVPVRCLTRGKRVSGACAAEVAQADLATGEGLGDALRGVTEVIHLAGATKVLRAEEYYAGNVRATDTLVRAIADRPVRLVHVSSLAAIGPSVGGVPVEEDAEPRPVGHYGKSKLAAEGVVRRWKPDAVIVRPPVVYGPGDTDVFQVLQAASRGWAVEIGGGERWFSAIYVKDLAEALAQLAGGAGGAGRAYFLAHPKAVSWRGLTEAAGQIMGVRLRRLQVPPSLAYAVGCAAELWARVRRRPSIISREKVAEGLHPCWTCSSRRAADELGIEARTTLETGLAQTLAWYKESGWLQY